MISTAIKLYPNTTLRAARVQYCRLLRAKRYLAERGLCALGIGSKFQYERSTGSVLK